MEINLTTSYVGILSLIVFVLAYAVVMAEEFSHLRKSKPVIISAALIWAIIASHFAGDKEYGHEIEHALEHNVLEFAELFLFLLVAMTYINALEERKVFDNVRYQLTSRGFSFRQLFIFTGIITFFLSPIADNLTTALVMCSVVMACGKGNSKFISIGCINIVVAANAGGAFSPFGDITTLMVWQAGIVEFFTFFKSPVTVWFSSTDFHGAARRNRTADLMITNQLLYLLSYGGRFTHFPPIRYNSKVSFINFSIRINT